MKRILSLFLSLIFVVTFSACSLLLDSSASDIKCPNFVGMTVEEIINDDELADMFDYQYEEDYNEEYECGVIFDQSVNEGTYVKKGRHIILNVSIGTKNDE